VRLLDRSHVSGSPSATLVLRSFLGRLALVIAILGVPILGTSFVVVSQFSAEINTATREHAALITFRRVASLQPVVESLHRSLGKGNAAMITARARLDHAVVRLDDAGLIDELPPAGRAHWDKWRTTWLRQRQAPTAPGLDDLLAGLVEICADIADNAPLDYDPSDAVQNLVAMLLRWEPQSVAALRRTADTAIAAKGPRLAPHAIALIATDRAVEREPLAQIDAEFPIAIALEPSVSPRLAPLYHAANTGTAAFEAHVKNILDSDIRAPGDAGHIESLVQRGIDAHERLWSSDITVSDRLILQRLRARLAQRRITVALSLLALLSGTLGIVLIGRYMARRDRMELASTKLEREALSAELHRMTAERALRLQEAQFKTVFDNTNLGIAIFDERGALVDHNAAVDRIVGNTATAFLTQLPEMATFEAMHLDSFTHEECRVAGSGQTQWLELTFSRVYGDGACRMIILLLRDTTEERELHQRLFHDANHDSLTLIANRASFDRALAEQLECCRLGEPFVLMYVDLDRFKPINDTHGHAAGDFVLIATAERLRTALAGEDLCARLGGDEFAVIVRHTSDHSAIATIAARIATRIAAPILFGDTSISVTASIGIALGLQGDESCEQINRHADAALYAAKERGGNMHVVFDPQGERRQTVTHSRALSIGGEPLREAFVLNRPRFG